MPEYEFTIYVAGLTPHSERAVASMRRLCAECIPGDHRIDIVDVLAEPLRAEADNVIATPTVIRMAPHPERRVLGDLSDMSRVVHELEIPSPRGSDRLG